MNDIIKKDSSSYVPSTLEEYKELAKIFSSSSMCPKSFRKNTGEANQADILIAMLAGAELGIRPNQAVQNIAVINGKPSLYGDAPKALVMSHPDCEYIKEWIDGDFSNESCVAHCLFKRKNHPEVSFSFSVKDAVRAGLWKKAGPWTTYPLRMLQLKARNFCLRDGAPDILLGLSVIEDENVIEGEFRRSPSRIEESVTLRENLERSLDTPIIIEEPSNSVIDMKQEAINMINECQELQKLSTLLDVLQSLPEDQKPEVRKIYAEKFKQLSIGDKE